MDVLPTILELTRTPAPDVRSLDGISFRAVLAGAARLPERRLFWMYKGAAAARDGDWKLTEIDGRTSLFNLGADLGEATDVAPLHPDIVAELSAALQRWKADVAPTPSAPTADQAQAPDR